MTIIMSTIGMLVGIIRDIARARKKEEFDWEAWIGERPWQFLVRMVVTIGIVGEQATTWTSEAVSGSFAEAYVSYLTAIVAFLMGLYGDRAGKTLLEKAEEWGDHVPWLRTLVTLGKKIS